MKQAAERARGAALRALRSKEVYHSRKGVKLMARRGLHGAKNWVLEPLPDGSVRPFGKKALRASGALSPLILPGMAMTGGDDGMGFFESVPLSLALAGGLITWWSARERRAGREEPWKELPRPPAETTESEAGGGDSPASEAPTVSLEKPQVTAVLTKAEGVPTEDESRIVDQKPLPEAPASHEVSRRVSHEAPGTPPSDPSIQKPAREFTLIRGGGERARRGAHGVTRDDFYDWAKDPESGLSETPSPVLVVHPLPERPTGCPEEAPTGQGEMQVRPGIGVSRGPTREVSRDSAEAGQSDHMEETPESGRPTERPAPPPEPTPVVPPETAPDLQVPESVGHPDGVSHGVSHDPVQGGMSYEYAKPGPYPVTKEPITEDWWLTPPDVPQEEAPEAQEIPEAPLPPEPRQEAAQPPSGPQEGPSALPDAASRYVLTTTVPDCFTGEEIEEARRAVVEWTREAIRDGSESVRSVSRMTGVPKSTVHRWTSDGE